MKLTEFAGLFAVSERHARRLFSEYQADIDGHYHRDGRKGTELDDYAVEYLKSKLKKQFEIVTPGSSDKERELEDQLKKLLVEYAETSKKLADAERRAGEGAGAILLLEAAKEQQADLKDRVAQAEARADQAEQERHQMEVTLEGIRREAQYRADEAQDLDDQRARAEAKVADLQAKLDQLAVAGWRERRKILKDLKKRNKE